MFLEEDMGSIMKTPLRLQETTVGLFWAHSVTGEYTVKAGYRSANGSKAGWNKGGNNEESGSRSEVNAKGWKVLWNLKMNIN